MASRVKVIGAGTLSNAGAAKLRKGLLYERAAVEQWEGVVAIADDRRASRVDTAVDEDAPAANVQ